MACIFRQLFDPQSSTYTYLLGCSKTKEAVLIDPVFEQARRWVGPARPDAARFDLGEMVTTAGATTTAEAVDYLLTRLLRVPAASATRAALVAFLTSELGTDDLSRARTYMEDALRMTAHLVMNTPEYQLV